MVFFVCPHLTLIELLTSIIKCGLISVSSCGKFLVELFSSIASDSFVYLYCLIFNDLSLLPGTCGSVSLNLGHCVWKTGWMMFASSREDFRFFGGQNTDRSACFYQGWMWFEAGLQDLGKDGLLREHSLSGFSSESWTVYQDPPLSWQALNSSCCFPRIKRLPKSLIAFVSF